METLRVARRRQLANLYQAGSDDAILRRRRSKKRSSQFRLRTSTEAENVHRELERALYGSVVNTLQHGPKRPWHYGYQNQTGLSGSGPLAAASRYGSVGTLRMLRRDASASSGGNPLPEHYPADASRVDEWSPPLRCSTSPSLVTMTTPKTWPESATYPHGSLPKRMQPSPWYDAETTTNDARACTTGSDMRRVAASHSYTLLILQRNALLENASRKTSPPTAIPGGSKQRVSTAGCGRIRSGTKGAILSRQEKLGQAIGCLGGDMIAITTRKDPVKHGLRAALKERLARQTDDNELKWNILKQVLKVIRGAQDGAPLEAVEEVAATFGKVVGTSKLATKVQFIANITGKHVGFPESELTTLFTFFKSSAGKAESAVSTTCTLYYSKCCRRGSRRGAVNRMKTSAPLKRAIDRGGGSGNAAQGADWTAAVASLRLLVKPKEPVLSTALGVFEIFARARENRIHHRKQLQRGRLKEERKRVMAEEQEHCKRRKGWEQKQRAKSRDRSPRVEPDVSEAPLQTWTNGGDSGDSCNRASPAETLRMFLLVCSNEEEIHTVKTTYWHRFRLELEAVMKERQTHGRSKPRSPKGDGIGGGGGGGDRASAPSTKPARSRSLSPRRRSSSNIQRQHKVHPNGGHIGSPGQPFTSEGVGVSDAAKEAFSVREEGVTEGGEDNGVTVDHFSEALARCPEMLKVFGKQLEGLRYRYHRPSWMAPILRKGG